MESKREHFIPQLDVVAFANLAQLHFIDKDVQHALRDALAESFPNLVGLVTRIKERAYPDWDELWSSTEKSAKEAEKPADDAEKGKVRKLLSVAIISR